MSDPIVFRVTMVAGVLSLLALTAGCGSQEHEGATEPEWARVRSEKPHDEQPQIDSEEANTLAQDNTALTLELYHAVSDGDADGLGFSVSAYSLRNAFAMVYAGSTGPAHTQMATTLHYSLPDERQHVAFNALDAQLSALQLPATDTAGAVELRTANGVWVLDELAGQIKSAYLDILAIDYDSGVQLAEFDTQPEAERVALNAWVAARTNDLIRDLFTPGSITSDTAMLVVNALYVEAPWATPFEPSATDLATFTRLDGSVLEVDMMYAFDLAAEYGEGPEYQAIAIPLRGQALELMVILPNSFEQFEEQLDGARFDAIRRDMAPTIVTTRMPKFELASSVELTDELRELGMNAPFDDDHSFDGIVDRLGVITTVAQQTNVILDERGVKAAAATGIVISVTSASDPSATITVDRPFVFAIRDKQTDTLLFLGRVLEPN